jgi:SAM-dependent methyltransferase
VVQEISLIKKTYFSLNNYKAAFMIDDAELFELIKKIYQSEKADGNNYTDYAASYDTFEKVAALRNHYRRGLAYAVPSFKGSIGCDLGCWLGFSTLILSSLGARCVYGIEVRADFIEQAERWRINHQVDGVRFRPILDVIPLQSKTMDWVVINQVLCNALPDSFPSSLAEAVRILSPGGTLFFADSNNPYCPETLVRLKKTWCNYEIGSGTPENPDGPHYKARAKMITEMAPDLKSDQVSRLARETCYMWRAGIEESVHLFLEKGETPGSTFQPDMLQPTVNPVNGGANGNITDPYVLCRDMERTGLNCYITCSAGGPPLDNELLHQQLEKSQGFYIYGVKTNAENDKTHFYRNNRFAKLFRKISSW